MLLRISLSKTMTETNKLSAHTDVVYITAKAPRMCDAFFSTVSSVGGFPSNRVRDTFTVVNVHQWDTHRPGNWPSDFVDKRHLKL